ncbi:MAG: hypothetical protein KKF52_00245 [Nanoarchaeota archaeon]|nr:hypothetical protein [Nanoarchaeota archaeon]MBU4241640.1 hypothetical protein [Nanoarchaeota archaeon]MBU4351932.1 hypothetical protein [Nanoarchaeota archaeon]
MNLEDLNLNQKTEALFREVERKLNLLHGENKKLISEKCADVAAYIWNARKALEKSGDYDYEQFERAGEYIIKEVLPRIE